MSLNQFRINTQEVNLRSTPEAIRGNFITTLPQGHLVTKTGVGGNGNAWYKVSTLVQGTRIEGYIKGNLLKAVQGEADATVPPGVIPGIPVVHLKNSPLSKRNLESGRAYPLSESGQPTRDGNTPEERVIQLREIIEWLSVDKSARYAPNSNQTFCNIYAYDYCHLAGVYLPRVWWSSKAIATITQGQQIGITYAQTVFELNANSLFNWLEEFGRDFGWRRSFNLTEIQNAVNNGEVGIICAQRWNLNQSGHICAVVPENNEEKATKVGGEVTIPVQSQAGVNNYKYHKKLWWTGQQFKKYSFWINS